MSSLDDGAVHLHPAHVRRGLFLLPMIPALALVAASLRARVMAPALLGFAGATHFQRPGSPSILQPP
jgi:hypothetical protein